MDKEEKKVTTKKTTTKKTSSTKKTTTAKKTAATKSTSTKKPVTKKTTSTKSSTVAKKTTTKPKTTTKKPTTSKSSTAKKTTTKSSTTSKKPTTKKTTTTKSSTTVKKTTTKKPTTKKSTPKKVTPKKVTPKEVVEPAKDEEIISYVLVDNLQEGPSNVVIVDQNKIEDKIDELLSNEEVKPVEEPTEEEIKPVEEEVKIVEINIPKEETKPVVKKKKILRGWVYVFLMAVCVCLLITFIFKLINGRPINDVLNEKYVKTVENKISIDFDEVKKENNEVVGYIKVDGTDIKHFVVKGNNNSYYLNHDFNKNDSSDGWVFMDSSNKMDGTDMNLVIYGLDNRKMFGSLSAVLKSSWQENKHEITFVTKTGYYKYKVISTYETDKNINFIYDKQVNYLKYVSDLMSKSNYNYKSTISSIDTLLTLVAIDGDHKIVLHAKRVE